MFLLGPWYWSSITDWPLLIFLRVLVGGVGCCVAKARVLAEASFVAQFKYAGIPLATLWGWFIFKALSDFCGGVGIIIIIFFEIYLYRSGKVTPNLGN